MGFNIETSVPMITVFLQGLLSFFSPCVLPLVPLYVSYLAGGARYVDENGTVRYPRKKVLLNTIFFVIGVSFAFFLLGFGFTALGMFFKNNRLLFSRIAGIIMILFGLYQFGLFGKSGGMGREHRLSFGMDKWAMGPVPALLLGFTFSFAWTPCVGPTLGSVLLMAGSAASSARGFLLIGVYTLGFTLPFLAVGIFTGTVLDFFKKHQNVVRYTVKIGAALLILMGFMTLTGLMNGLTGYLSNFGGQNTGTEQNTGTGEPEADGTTGGPGETGGSQEADGAQGSSADTDGISDRASADGNSQAGVTGESSTKESTAEQEEPEAIPALDFTLKDQFGNEHTLSDYKGKTVFLNFWGTWCPPCRGEMPEIQKLYENYGENEEDLIVLGIAAPNYGQEGDIDHITSFLSENGYTFPVVMDEEADLFYQYGITSFPTTFMIDSEGNVFGYVQSAITGEIMESIVQQTMTGVRY